MSLTLNSIDRPADPPFDGIFKWFEIVRFLLKPIPRRES